jgi:alpha-acetolactate decarboxylase
VSLPVSGQYPGKYTSEWTLSGRVYDSCQCAQQNTPHCVDSIQQTATDSEQSPVSNKIYGSGHTVQQNMWQWPQCPKKYMAVATVSNKIYDSGHTVQQNMWHWPVSNNICGSGHSVQQNIRQWQQCPTKYVAVASVQQNVAVATVSNKIYGSGQCPTIYVAVATVANKIYLRQRTVS